MNHIDKAIGEEKFGIVSIHTEYIFGVSVNIGEENVGR